MKQLFITILLSAVAVLPLAAQKEYSLENTAVSRYLADPTYDGNTSYAMTVVTKYNTSSVYAGARHRPVPVALTWSPKEGTLAQTLILSENADFSKPLVFTPNANSNTYSVYNLIPGRTYYYKVLADMGGVEPELTESSSFKTTGKVRMIYVDGVNNVRDLGGWSTSFGTPIKYERVYRGANLDNITATGRVAFHDQVGVRTELDLRRADETIITSSPLGPDVNYLRIPTTEYYNGMANQPTTLIDDFKYIVQNLRQGRPTMFHCLIGADRTGTLAFMQEGVLGVSEADLCRDYELTTFSVSGNRLRQWLWEVINYVKGFRGSNLQQEFYNYLLSKGMTREELDDYIAIMLDNYTLPTRINTGADQYKLKSGDTLMIVPEFYPVNYAPSVVYSSSNEAVATVTPEGKVVALKAGRTVIRVSVGFHSEVCSEVAIIVQQGEESAVPLQVAQPEGTAINIYSIVGENLLANGSFEYLEPTALWTDVNNEQLGSPYFVVPHEGALNGKRYLQSAGNGDSTSPASIVRSLPVEAGKTYVLGYSIKNTDGQKVTANLDIKVILKTEAKATGSTDDFSPSGDNGGGGSTDRPGGTVDDFVIGSNAFVAADGPKQMEHDFHPTYDGEWTPQVCIITVPEGYTWVELQFANLGSHGGATCLDNMYMAEALAISTIPSAKAYLNQVVANIVIANYGDEPLQHPVDKAKAVNKALDEAKALANGNPTAENIANAINSIRLAVADYSSSPLNAPDPQVCYLVESGGKVLTPNEDQTAGMAAKADNVDQGFRFLYTTQPNVYVLEHPLDDGTSLYLKVEDNGALTLTPNEDDATPLTVASDDQQGLAKLMAGTAELFSFSITPDYGIINVVDSAEAVAPVVVAIYNLNGQPQSALQTGLNIVRYSDGSTRVIKK